MEGRPSAPKGAESKNGEAGVVSQRHRAGYAEKQPSPRNRQCERGPPGVRRDGQHP